MFSFHHGFLQFFAGVFIVDCICSLHHCFFRCFHFSTDFTVVFRVFWFHQLSLPWLLFVSYFVFVLLYRECYGLERAYFTLGNILSYTPPQHLAQPAFIKASLGPAVQPWRLHCLPLRFETQTQPIFLFESHSVQQKVLVGRFYLCIKDLWNTIITSSRFWTHCLIAICVVKPMSYPPGCKDS